MEEGGNGDIKIEMVMEKAVNMRIRCGTLGPTCKVW